MNWFGLLLEVWWRAWGLRRTGGWFRFGRNEGAVGYRRRCSRWGGFGRCRVTWWGAVEYWSRYKVFNRWRSSFHRGSRSGVTWRGTVGDLSR